MTAFHPETDAGPIRASAQKQSDLGLFGQGECVLYVDTKVANSVLNLRVTKQDLNRTDVASRFVNDRNLGSAKRVCSVLLWLQTNRLNPLID